MLFNSFVFISLFFPLSVALTCLAPARFGNAILVALSFVFYCWGEPRNFYVVLVSIGLNFIFGRWIEKRRATGAPAKHLLVAGISLNLLILVAYKYSPLLVQTWNDLCPGRRLPDSMLRGLGLPLGISFFTFHGLSYLIDIHRGACESQKRYSAFVLYILFFPQLIAGPIVRYAQINRQLTEREVSWNGFSQGVQRFIIGLAKKVLLADLLAGPADRLFALPSSDVSFVAAWVGMLSFSLQIYFDFSGYSDMAIGLARVFGFTFPENFNDPYAATSMRDFWRRWHISLSTWFRDYLYKPLGGSRAESSWRVYRNLIIVFFLCGIWHGASWLFALWGLVHGVFLILERTSFGNWLSGLKRPYQLAYTWLVIIFSWTIFRADTLRQAGGVLMAMVGAHGAGNASMHTQLGWQVDTTVALVCGILACVPRQAWLVFFSEPADAGAVEHPLKFTRFACLLALFFTCFLCLATQTHHAFIYFRF